MLGVVALEGQGQDELFDVLAGFRRPTGGSIEVEGRRVAFRHPADAIAAGLTLVPGNRADALLAERSVRENIALPLTAEPGRWGLIPMRREGERVAAAIERLQIDTRAQGEVRRLSGGNQQKVTIARWVATGVRTLLLFDPTRGIDVRTKGQIYPLVRELAAQGAAVLFYTSELDEVRLACDRAVVIFKGRLVEIVDRVGGERGAADAGGLRADRRRGRGMIRLLTRSGWVLGLVGLLVLLAVVTRLIQPGFGASGFESLGRAALPFAFATAGMTVAVLVGGIDLSVASMMAVASVTAAVLMDGAGDGATVLVVLLVLVLGLVMGTINGALIVATRVPDIVVTLAMLFVWEGVALLILQSPGGAATPWLRGLIVGSVVPWVPNSMIFLVVCLLAIWLPLQRSKLGLSIYAVGSDPLAAYRSGVAIGRTRIAAYAICGLFSALGGLTLTMTTGIGEPIPGPYLLASVAAVVLGGVVLGGGVGGLLGPILAVFVLRLVRMDLTLAAVDPNVTTIVEGTIMVVVVMLGGVLAFSGRST